MNVKNEQIEEKDRMYLPEYCLVMIKTVIERDHDQAVYEGSIDQIADLFLGYSNLLRNACKDSYSRKKALGQIDRLRKTATEEGEEEEFITEGLKKIVEESNPPRDIEELKDTQELFINISQLARGATESEQGKTNALWMIERLIKRDLPPEVIAEMQARADRGD